MSERDSDSPLRDDDCNDLGDFRLGIGFSNNPNSNLPQAPKNDADEKVALENAVDAGLDLWITDSESDVTKPIGPSQNQLESSGNEIAELDPSERRYALTMIITDPCIENTYFVTFACGDRRVGLMIYSERKLSDLLYESALIESNDKMMDFLLQNIKVAKLIDGKQVEVSERNSLMHVLDMAVFEIAIRQRDVEIINFSGGLAMILGGQEASNILEVLRIDPIPLDFVSKVGVPGFLSDMGLIDIEETPNLDAGPPQE